MFAASFERQSSVEDWEETIQLFDESDGSKLWTSVPSDLVLTLTVILDVGPQCAEPPASITAVSTDGSDRIRAEVNGFVLIAIDQEDIAELAPERAGVDTRYLVYIKAETEGVPTQALVGVLPIYLGH
jgi:hypothetical protein